MSRRLPVYLLIDSSGSMQGEPIEAVNVGLKAMLSALRQDPYALESVHLSLVTFDVQVKELLPLTPLVDAQIGDIELPRSGATHLGEGLHFILERVKQDVVRSTPDIRGDFRPMLFVMTDGSPSDLQRFREAVPKIKACEFASVVACAAGPKAKREFLTQLTDKVVALDTMDGSAFEQFFKWVSDSITAGSKNAGVENENSGPALPPPPPEVQVVI